MSGHYCSTDVTKQVPVSMDLYTVCAVR